MNILIAVPTLNSWTILPKLISSLKKQTNENWKLLFIDGKSNKEHENYLEKICNDDKRFMLIKDRKSVV